ncbi:MAG: cell division protein FtsZ [Candidatus Liptonbacteria bacterium]|nr:cell division protein FtsZ [Candidatus Liptonbacteria bacterium]
MKKKSHPKIKIKKEKLDNSPIVIKVVGIGGGGGNAISRMSRNFIRGVEFIAINTDHQDLDRCGVRRKIYIGRNLTRGLGTGMNPDIGRQAAEENRSEIAEALKGADLVFLAAGFGGGTGTGATPVVAEIAKQAGALTLAFVTRPFGFEGSQRDRISQEGLAKLRDRVDALIVVPNDRIFSVISKDTPLLKAFEAIDDVLRSALQGIVELIVAPGIINLDFADVRSIMENAGTAIVGLGIASGPERATEAVKQSINSPLIEVNAEGAKAILLGISGGRDLGMNEVSEAARLVAQAADPGARIIFGAYRDRNLKPNQIKITLIATGINGMLPANSLFGTYQTKRESFLIEERNGGSGGKFDDLPAASPNAKEKNSPLASDKPEHIEPKKKPPLKPDKESDIWDIPTFLRRKKK